MSETWIHEAEQVISKMSHRDVTYHEDFIWCGNEDVEAWFFPDGTCEVTRDGHTRKVLTKDALPELLEAPPAEDAAEGSAVSPGLSS